jgi:hypothetical protein
MSANMSDRYPIEDLDGDYEDDGTMPQNVAELKEAVVGRRIVKAENEEVPGRRYGKTTGLVLTLDDGKRVMLRDTDDCCAHTYVESFLLHPERIDHAILGVGTTDGYTKWHIYADLGDVLELEVKWSCGNAFYYGYGFDITVEDLPTPEAALSETH